MEILNLFSVEVADIIETAKFEEVGETIDSSILQHLGEPKNGAPEEQLVQGTYNFYPLVVPLPPIAPNPITIAWHRVSRRYRGRTGRKNEKNKSPGYISTPDSP